MANITINEISSNYTYNIGTSTFATVALPITASWGPGFYDSNAAGISDDLMLEETTWQHFPATQSGLESFVSTYRGPAANYRLAEDYSYQMALTLITSGYDVLVCRLSPGTHAENTFNFKSGAKFTVKAKYPGTFGNSLLVTVAPVPNYKGVWNLVTYVIDASGVKVAVENKIFVFDIALSTDSILHISELSSDFCTFSVAGKVTETDTLEDTQTNGILLTGGTDKSADAEVSEMMTDAINLAKSRYGTDKGTDYIAALTALSKNPSLDESKASNIRYMEWLYTKAIKVYDLLKDKLAYNPQRIISPGWDDQNIKGITGQDVPSGRLSEISPIHIKLMDVAYYSRCATSLLDIPRSLPRSGVYDTSNDTPGYAQMLARYIPENSTNDVNGSLYSTHSALFAPWGHYTYTGTSKQNIASPAFITLMVQRAMILNQTLQYEWALPTNRKHSLKLGKLDYNVPKKILDQWQSLEGVGVNVITTVPDLGTNLWGNSTLYEVPPATYQALANLSTRYLMNAVENVVYKCGINITFHYNNEQAYNMFYAGVTPLLDTMKNVGAIEGYYVKMAADIDKLDQVNANTVVGKIYLQVNGVINDIIVDLVALPPNVDLDQFKG